MKLTIPRAILLGLLQKVIGVIESKQTMQILSNVLIKCVDGRLSLTATDSEIELIAEADLPAAENAGDSNVIAFTTSARKLLDICQSLSDGSVIDLIIEDQTKLRIHSGKARFSLPAMAADRFPCFETPSIEDKFCMDSARLRRGMDQCKFAIAVQDTRIYLNALLMEVEGNLLRLVASDGHRLAYSEQQLDNPEKFSRQVLVPLKGVKELSRLLATFTGDVEICLSGNMLRALYSDTIFSVKLMDAKYFEYRRNISRVNELAICVAKEPLKQALTRVCVVCHEKFKVVRFVFDNGMLALSAINPENEEASDVVEIDYPGPALDTAFNGSYIMDVITHCDSEQISFGLSDADAQTPCIIEANGDTSGKFVVMPLRL